MALSRSCLNMFCKDFSSALCMTKIEVATHHHMRYRVPPPLAYRSLELFTCWCYLVLRRLSLQFPLEFWRLFSRAWCSRERMESTYAPPRPSVLLSKIDSLEGDTIFVVVVRSLRMGCRVVSSRNQSCESVTHTPPDVLTQYSRNPMQIMHWFLTIIFSHLWGKTSYLKKR